MVDTTMFVLQLIGLFAIVFWALTSDRPGGERRGLLALRPLGDEQVPSGAEPRRAYRSSLISKRRSRTRPEPGRSD